MSRVEVAGVEVCYDDRPKVSPGVKFKDAELIGAPFILVVGRGLETGEVELKAHVMLRLVDFKVPREIRVLRELPRNATGKLVKGGLR